MTDKEIIRLLPTQPLCEVLKATMECPELHPSFITFKRVSVETGRIEWQELMTPEDIDRIAKASKRRWGALCHCTFCGENFYTGWHSHRDMSGPLMFIGDDESLYPGWTEDIDDGNQRIEITEGDQGNCPMCGEGATFVKYGALKTGRTYQRLFASIEFVGDLAAIVTWLAGCSIDADGVSDEYILPRDAAVLTERGFLRCYTQSRKGQFITCERNTGTWQRVKQKSDPMQKMFYTYDACCGRCFGVERLLLTYGSFDGTSAEKTGLTGGIDVQKDCLYWVIRAWGDYMTSQLIACGKVQTMEEIEPIMNTEFKLPGGDTAMVNLTLMDSGDRTDEVYEFYYHNSDWMLPCKGTTTMTSHYRLSIINKAGSKATGMTLVLVDGGKYKDLIAARMRKSNGQGSWMVFDGIDDEYAEQVTAEHKLTVRSNGRDVERWVKKTTHADNHYLDCEVYAAAAADVMGVRSLYPDESGTAQPKQITPPSTSSEENWISENEEWI